MIRALILYYLSIKPTHGYEIQKFIQVSGADTWTKIQSGSIYYALAKLEKEACIQTLREERTGSRVRKIFEITETGQKELVHELKQELSKPIISADADKFLIGSMLNELPKDVLQHALRSHITELQEKKAFWEKWKQAKISDKSLLADKISFDMTIDSLNYQILWHEEMLNNTDSYIEVGIEMQNLIKSIDFSNIDDKYSSTTELNETVYIQELRNEIINNPASAAENLDKLIEELKKK
ncbi:DNA-binding PadR family transcriptional regulator [Paenibacillus anaericanus]|uniref:PadR family transcriptional regulator n=1 Tax=Paenibacillus anaericanus TaxID=170367 RepID=UPI00277FF425|nr:PadR family transcriptional regulator [Paenibacillus anaericanus]MDQ0086660.1 DNA-binding PadR family transcriptional regulator [Paenibacillus anaericanus]